MSTPTHSTDHLQNEIDNPSMHTLPETNYRRADLTRLEIDTNIMSPARRKPIPSLRMRMAAEGCGTFLFIFIALATVNQTALNALLGKYEVSQFIIALGFAIGLSVGVHISGPISGGHLNPAISFSMTLFESLPWMDCILYILAQMIGAFFASLLVFCIYYNTIRLFPYDQVTAGFFGTLKASQTSIGLGFLEQVIGTGLLMFGILMVVRENPKKPNVFLIGGILGSLALFLGNNGFAFNMARDLGPRMMSAIFWGADVFSYENHWWWVPIVGSFVGAPLGHLAFNLFELHLTLTSS